MAKPDDVKPRKLSFTALERFRFCPWVYYLADICKKGIPTYSQSLSLGAILHLTLEAFHRQGPLFPMDEAQLLAHYHRLWEEQVPRFLFKAEGEEESLKADGERILRAFFAQEQQGQAAAQPEFIEADFKVPLRPGFLLTGRIDRIDRTAQGTYRVLDYKSSRRPLDQLMRPEESLQLALYGLGAKAITGEMPESIGFYYLAHNVILLTQFTPAAEQRVLAEFSALADAIESQVFTPDPEPEKCASCPYQPQCPVYHPEAAQIQY